MEIEKKIYAPWAFENNEQEKGCMNMAIYEELKKKYKFASDYKAEGHEEEYDLIYSSNPGYAHTTYRIIKNNTNLSRSELALIFDEGNLCFGFGVRNGNICVYTD